MIKAVFFDVDGTLLSHTLHAVPDSTRLALRDLRQSGIQCVVATGRHLSELEQLPLQGLDFDGYLTLNGQLCLDENKQFLFGTPIAGAEKETVLRLFAEKRIPVMLIEQDAMYLNYVDRQVEEAQLAISTPVPPTGVYAGGEIYQAIAYLDRAGEAQLAKQLPNCTLTRWNDSAVDIIPAGGGKAAGMAAYLRRTGIQPSEIMAFGDGENDLDMLRFAGFGVAMGNADAAVKSAADYVTESIDRDGVARALKFWKLIP